MLDSHLLALTALLCGVASAAPIPQTASSSTSSSAASALRGSLPVTGGDVANSGEDPVWPYNPPTVAETPQGANLPEGYSLLVFHAEVMPEGNSNRQKVHLEFIDNDSLNKDLTSKPTGSCDYNELEGDLSTNTHYTCNPGSFQATQNQAGRLRGDGESGSTPTFSVDLFGGSQMNTQYNIDFKPSLWNHPNITCSNNKPPFTCDLKLQSPTGLQFTSVSQSITS